MISIALRAVIPLPSLLLSGGGNGELGMGNWEWGDWEWETGNGGLGMGSLEWGTGNGVGADTVQKV